jgi:tetratricopeptide (TPR) repeat protein
VIFSFNLPVFPQARTKCLCVTLAFWMASVAAFSPAQSRSQPTAVKESVGGQNELNQRIEAANAAQASGNPVTIAETNRRLLAVTLHLMGQIRVSEGIYPQAAELYRAALSFESLPGIHSDLALADQLSGNPDEAIQQGQLALAAQSDDLHNYITLSRAYIAKKDFANADKVLTQAAHLHPDIDTLYLIAVSWLSEAQPDSRKHADAIFQQMLQIAGDSGSLHVLIGRAYRDAGLMPDAVKEFKRAIELDTTTPHAHYFLGLAMLSMNEWKPTPEAQAELEKEVQYHPNDFLANYMLGYLASSQRQYAVADKYLKTATAINPAWPDPVLYLGLDAYAQGDNAAAEPLLRKAVELTGTDESRGNFQIRRAYVDLGRILARSGREQEADEFSAKARDLENKVMRQTQQNASVLMEAEGGKVGSMAAVVPLDDKQENGAPSLPGADGAAPVDVSAFTNSSLTPEQREAVKAEEDVLRPIIGQSYSDLATSEAIQHNYAAALVHYEAAEQWNPDIPGLEKNLGQAAFRADNYPEAIHGLSLAVKANPDSMALRAMLGMAYFEMKRYGDAATAFYPLGEAGMRDPAVGYAWAASLAKTGDLKDASQVLTLYQGMPLSKDGLLLVGQLWTEIGDYDRAVTTLRQALASDPSLPKAHYAIAIADIHSEKWPDAATELNAELAISPGDPDTLYNLGFVDLQESKNEDAARLFRQVIAAHPDYANAQYQLGKLLMDSGKTQDALTHLEAAAKLIPDKDYVHYQLQAAYRRLSRTADADRELAVYQDLKAKSRAQVTTQIDQQLQQKQ